MQYIDMHLSNIHNETEFDQKEIGIGDIVKFLYKGTTRFAMVMNTGDNKGLLHALVLEKISPDMLHRFKMMMGVNVDVDPQTFYKSYMADDATFKSSDCYRTFNKGEVNQVAVLDYKFGYGGKDKYISYGAMREFTEAEMGAVAYDYFSNVSIRIGKFPGLVKTTKQMIAALREATIEYLDPMYLSRLENSAVPSVMLAPDPLRTAMNWAMRNRDYDFGGETFGRVRDTRIAISSGNPIPPAVVILYNPDNRYLLSGDVRMCMAASKGFNLGVKVLHYEEERKDTKQREEGKEKAE